MTESNILKYQTFKTDKLIEYARNPRKNDFVVDRMVSCIKEFGFRIPIVAKSDGSVVDGHLRLKAARKMGLEEVPVVIADDLSEAQIKAFRLVANQSANWAEWDEELLRLELLDLKEMDFDLDLTGFDMSEVDRPIQANREIHDDDFDESETSENVPQITKQGDLWILGKHRLLCSDPTDQNALNLLMNNEKADMIFTDAPTDNEPFEKTILNLINFSKDGSIHYICANWKLMYKIISIARSHYSEFKQLCVWKKDRAQKSEFYDEQHELIFVFKNGIEKHINNFHLGETGRYRTNIWDYAENDVGEKSVPLIADAILDCSHDENIILDPSGKTGTTMIASEETDRKCCMMESDPKCVDTIVRRWQKHTGKSAILESTEKTFDEVEG